MFGAALLALHLMGNATVKTVRPAPFDAVIGWLRRPLRRPDGAVLLGTFWWMTMGSAALVALAIAFDGRHRDFPTIGLWIPALAFALHAARAGLAVVPGERREEAWTSAAILIAGLFGNDWWGNVEAWKWIATCLLLAAPGLPNSWAEALRLGRLFQADQAQAGHAERDYRGPGVVENQAESGQE